MTGIWKRRCLSCVSAVGVCAVAALLWTRAVADGKRPPAEAAKPPANFAQNVVPVAIPIPNVRDHGKGAIELPTKVLLAQRSAPATAAPRADFVNPKVQPGKVRWHKDFAAARAAAVKSHKPILLFQMMGNLDDRFC